MADDKSATLAQSLWRLADSMRDIRATIRSLSEETITQDEYVALQVMRVNAREVYDELKNMLKRRPASVEKPDGTQQSQRTLYARFKRCLTAHARNRVKRKPPTGIG